MPKESAQTDLYVMVLKYDDAHTMRFIYRSDCYLESTIRSFADKYVRVLKDAVGDFGDSAD